MDIYSYINLVFPQGLSLNEALGSLWPVVIYLGGMTAYALFIFHFYRFLAARDMFAMDLSKYEESRHRAVRAFLQVVMYIAKYIIVFPVFAFFWFGVLTLILAFLSRDREFTEVLLIALATVSAIRISAYYNEDLSRDLAKILPFAVLAIFIIDASFFAVGDSLSVLRKADSHREIIFYYLVFLIGLEFFLRIIMGYLVLLLTVRRRPLQQPTTAESEAEGEYEADPEPAPEEPPVEEKPVEEPAVVETPVATTPEAAPSAQLEDDTGPRAVITVRTRPDTAEQPSTE